MKKSLYSVLILSAASALAACSADSASTDNAQPSTVIVTQTVPAETAVETEEQPEATSPTAADAGGFERAADNKSFTNEQLRELWVPALCGNEAGNLVGGELPPPAKATDVPKQAFLQSREDGTVMGAYTDINGDGKDEAVVSYYCDMGGVSWPHTLLIYDNDLNYLDMVEAEDMSLNGYVIYGAHIRDLRWDANKVYVDWFGWEEGDASCCASRLLSGELTMPGGTPSLTVTTDQPAA